MTAIGIIGGMGPLATCAFYHEVILATPAERDQDHLHVIIDSDPSIPDRTDYIFGNGADPRPSLIAAARRLVDLGCVVLAMPCNTAHAFADDIRAAIPVPLLDWIGITADELAATGTEPVALLATRGSLRAGLYQQALKERSIDTILPDDEDLESITQAIYGQDGVKGGRLGSERAQQRLVDIARRLVDRGAARIVLGCTELPLVLPAADERWPVPACDPAVVNAKVLVAVGLSDGLALSPLRRQTSWRP